jgi:hypothetical protein
MPLAAWWNPQQRQQVAIGNREPNELKEVIEMNWFCERIC